MIGIDTKTIRNHAKNYHDGGVTGKTLNDCADEIDRLRKYEDLVRSIIGDPNTSTEIYRKCMGLMRYDHELVH